MRVPTIFRSAFIALIVLFGVGASRRTRRQRQRRADDLQGRLDHRRLGRPRHAQVRRPNLSRSRSAASTTAWCSADRRRCCAGSVKNIKRASDVAGVYAAAGAGLAVGGGARAIVLTNQKGAVLELSGKQVGLMANADLSGLAITLK